MNLYHKIFVPLSLLLMPVLAWAGALSPSGLYSDAVLQLEVEKASVRAPAHAEVVEPTAPVAVAPSVSGPKMADITHEQLPKTKSGVPYFEAKELKKVDKIPRLDIGRETSLSASAFALDAKLSGKFQKHIMHPLESRDLLDVKAMANLTKPRVPLAGPVQNTKTVFFPPQPKVDRSEFDNMTLTMRPESSTPLKRYVPLTDDESRFLSGLLLFQKGDKCALAIGLFHKLSRKAQYQAEADYHVALCSKKIGLKADFTERARRVIDSLDEYYTPEVFKHVSADIPYDQVESFGKTLQKAADKISDVKDEKVKGTLAYILANYGAQTGRYQMALNYGKMVPANHPHYLRAQFLVSLGEYQVGSKDKALEIQARLIDNSVLEKSDKQFQALVAVNLARLQFQEKKFKQARETYLRVQKDHPLWLQSLTEMGWAQLQMGDYEGAIGNMYSIHSPFFNNVFKPESYVIRTIGYLQLCQYGDAYRSLSVLEKLYRPYMEKISAYEKSNKSLYTAVKGMLQAAKGDQEIDGMPQPVIREMARQKEFLNFQQALNHQVDEKDIYAQFDPQAQKALKEARDKVTYSRARIAKLKNQLLAARKDPSLQMYQSQWRTDLDKEFVNLNGYFFEIDLFNEAKDSIAPYKNEAVPNADRRIASIKSRIEKTLSRRLQGIKEMLVLVLDNNELLRYEAFAGSGENIRFQVAGGEVGKRVPANVIPQSKSLQWDFDGEYWEDELGHYRSSLKNNCPENKRNQASLEEGSR